jgi:hydrogenase nickel incorporation protein HypB
VNPPSPPRETRRTVEIRQAILRKNDAHAARLRQMFRQRGIHVVNLLSSPGSGKTMLLQRTLTDLADRIPCAVVVGDLATDNDARRLRASGVPVHQITTGTVCHLEANMIEQAVAEMDLRDVRLLFVENVGNLVCPAVYDLGEEGRFVLMSVCEGEDKPLKYPRIFKTADAVLLTKMDLADAVGFDHSTAMRILAEVAPDAEVLEVSARTGMGMEAWYDRLLKLTASP